VPLKGPLRPSMRLVLHDFWGHPFTAQLSRELATRGHNVMSWYCEGSPSGKGQHTRQPADPTGLSFRGLRMASPFDRYSPAKRVRQEIAYGRLLGRWLLAAKPEVAVLCNMPLISHAIAARIGSRAGIPMVFWHQDIVSVAVGAAAKGRLRIAGRPIARMAEVVERSIAEASQVIVPISADFLPVLNNWRVGHKSVVIQNWAPLPEIPVHPRDNPWARAHDLVGRPVLLYAGTLGLKHNPAVLAAMAKAMRSSLPSGRFVVISEGRGREWLAECKRREGLENLLLLDYQPYSRFPEVLAAADVLVAILEPSAGRYSVPSKILSYLCSARPIVAVIPHENAAAATLRESGGGIVIAPGDDEEAAAATIDLLCDDDMRSNMGSAGRDYAETTFDIHAIGDRFEEVLFRAGRSCAITA
jgi:colanic acid biosynthesis glycosyl transferase WcaI